jgi:hypothetical protein
MRLNILKVYMWASSNSYLPPPPATLTSGPQKQPPSSKILAYVEWFTKPAKKPHPDFQFFAVECIRKDSKPVGEVIELESIVQPCPLVPHFPK